MSFELPEEVVFDAKRHFGCSYDVVGNACVAKSAMSRGEAWDLVAEASPEILWRKIHTKHYWAWALIRPVPDEERSRRILARAYGGS